MHENTPPWKEEYYQLVAKVGSSTLAALQRCGLNCYPLKRLLASGSVEANMCHGGARQPPPGVYCFRVPGAACIASHNFGAVYGISRWSMPRGASASITALATAGGAPLQPASPTPLTPSGWNGFGVTVSPRSSGGISLARGTA